MSGQDSVGLLVPAMLLLLAPWQMAVVVLVADGWSPSPRRSPMTWLVNRTSHLVSYGISISIVRLFVNGHNALGLRGVLVLTLANLGGQIWGGLHRHWLLRGLGDGGDWRTELAWDAKDQIVQGLTTLVTITTISAVIADRTFVVLLPLLVAAMYYVRTLAANAHLAVSEVDATQAWLAVVRAPTALEDLHVLAQSLAAALRATSVTITLDGDVGTSGSIAAELDVKGVTSRVVTTGIPEFGLNRSWAAVRPPDRHQLSVLPLSVDLANSCVAVSYRSSGLDRVPAMRPDTLERAAWEISRAVERQRSRHELEHAAAFDALTGLLYRSLFLERLSIGLLTWTGTTVLILDIGQLREVNDLFGREVGDEVLREVARSLEDALPVDALTGRLGGHLFAAAFADDDPERASSVAKLLLRVLHRSTASKHGANVALTIGLAYASDEVTDAEIMLRRAELGLDDARKRGLPYEAFTLEAERLALRRLKLVPDLRAALRAGLIQAHYQPQVDPVDGHVVGMEALARWTHPELGFVPPDEFVDLAESSGLVHLLTTTMLRQALRQCRSWCEAGLGIPVSVNLSARSLANPLLTELVVNLLDEIGVPASRLVLEITETAVMEDRVACVESLTRLRGIGVTISIDDFGTGQSSLAYLRELPVDEVKLDRAFTHDLGDGRAVALVQASVSLAHSLGLRIVAEGVEDEATLVTLRELGVDIAQGYYVCRPGPPEVITQFLQDRASHSVAA